METDILHPSAFISRDDVGVIRNNAAEAERQGKLHPQQLEVIYRHHWFKLLAPAIYNGQQTDLPRLLQLQEAISWADGSTGWVVTLCCGAGWFGGFLPEEIAANIFKNEKVCLAGSGTPGGTAEITANGYRINGSWKYATGIHHATHITANCLIKKDGACVLENGEPLALPFIFNVDEVNLVPAWKQIGMVATGSDSFAINNLEVGRNRQFKIDPAAVIINEPLYRYPFLQLAETTLAVNLSGMAIHFMDCCEEIFREKIKQPRLTNEQRVLLTEELNRAKAAIDACRKDFYTAVDESWSAIQHQQRIPDDLLNKVSAVSRKLAFAAREQVDRLYPLCGLAAANTQTTINRVWRDLHTASQHALLTFIN